MLANLTGDVKSKVTLIKQAPVKKTPCAGAASPRIIVDEVTAATTALFMYRRSLLMRLISFSPSDALTVARSISLLPSCFRVKRHPLLARAVTRECRRSDVRIAKRTLPPQAASGDGHVPHGSFLVGPRGSGWEPARHSPKGSTPEGAERCLMMMSSTLAGASW